MINSNFGFTPLREVWLGDCYPASYYDHLPSEIRDAFYLITEWTKEDTGRLQKFLESRGIVVRRPKFESIDHYIDDYENLVKPPVTPRDHYLVLGQTLYGLHCHQGKSMDPWQHWIDHYRAQGFDVQQPVDQPINCIAPPSLVRIGRDLYVDYNTHLSQWGLVSEWAVAHAKDYRINICETNGHSDGVFCPVAKDTIVSSFYKTDYHGTFPKWDVFSVPKNLNNFLYPKNWLLRNNTIDNSRAFDEHILSKASDWVGNFQETVYEVNMLVIDQHNVVAMKEYPALFEWLKDRGINVHLFDLRTRSFWDGGWHCFTLDIHREDTKEDLFPERGDNGVYWRLN